MYVDVFNQRFNYCSVNIFGACLVMGVTYGYVYLELSFTTKIEEFIYKPNSNLVLVLVFFLFKGKKRFLHDSF